ncbi:MAG: hypothetical protein WCX17_03110 [Parcubacteria group bacterium]
MAWKDDLKKSSILAAKEKKREEKVKKEKEKKEKEQEKEALIRAIKRKINLMMPELKISFEISAEKGFSGYKLTSDDYDFTMHDEIFEKEWESLYDVDSFEIEELFAELLCKRIGREGLKAWKEKGSVNKSSYDYGDDSDTDWTEDVWVVNIEWA